MRSLVLLLVALGPLGTIAVAAQPKNGGLLFLQAYQWWFDGQRDRAAALLLKARTEDPGALLSDALSKASRAILGRALDYSEQQLETVMSPRHFVEVRTTYGGPAPSETARALSVSRANLARDKAAWQQRREHVATAERTLRERVAAL